MKKELSLECPYKISFENNEYFFYTDSGIKYILYFTNVEYFGNFYLKHNIFEFGFGPENGNNKNDKKVKFTVLAFLDYFFKKDKNRVLYFVTDSFDFKEKIRNRLFNIWKINFDKNNLFSKYDTVIKTEDKSYYCSMILYTDNIHREEYKRIFYDTGKEFENSK